MKHFALVLCTFLLVIAPAFLTAPVAAQDTKGPVAVELPKTQLPKGFRYLTESELAWFLTHAESRTRVYVSEAVLAPLNQALAAAKNPPGYPDHYPCGQHIERICGGGICFTVVVQEYCSGGFPDGEQVIQILDNQ